MTIGAGHGGPAAIVRLLRRDRIAVATFVVCALACLPYALPFSRAWLENYHRERTS